MDAAQAARVTPASPTGERRHVSVLFADMVGYTATLENLREDQAFEFAQAVYAILAGCVRDHEGSVHAFGGDSVMAVFGIGAATEEAALKACRAALAIHGCIAAEGDRLEARFGARPRMRVGVSSGLAIVAPVDTENAVLTTIGNTVNLASRIESLAPPEGCLICDETRRLVEWQVEAEFFVETPIKGVAKPQQLWRLLSVHEDASRFEASRGRGLSTLVGRDDTLDAMRGALDRAQQGLRVVDLVAEPGLGKTRLVYEFLSGLGGSELVVLQGHCTSDGRKTAFLPFLEVIRSSFGIAATDTRAVVGEKVAHGLASRRLDEPLHRALLLNLLGLKGDDTLLSGLDGVLIGLRTQELLRAIVLAECDRAAVLLVIEDIHWIDTASERVLRSLVASDDARNLLIVHTRRPEYFPRWSDKPAVDTLTLAPIGGEDLARVLAGRLGVESLPETLLQQVAERAGGNPLFSEEVLRFLVEQGVVRVEDGRAVYDGLEDDDVLPASLLGLLSARLDRLDPEDRNLLQVAAAVGKRFDQGLLAHAYPHGGPVEEALLRLAEQDILHRESESSYAFKHVLMRDCVYHGLLPQHRSQLHLAVARSIETRSEGRLVEAAETLAHHYSQTGEAARAFTYLVMAGNKSLNIFSLGEALDYFGSAMSLKRADPACSSDTDFVAMLADYAAALNLSLAVLPMLELADEVLPGLEAIPPTRDHVLFLHHYCSLLVHGARYDKALEIERKARALAHAMNDEEACAYALVSKLSVSTYVAPLPDAEYAAHCRDIEAVLPRIEGAYLKNFYLASLGWDQICRGQVARAADTAQRLVDLGTSDGDPRALGYGLAMQALGAAIGDDFEAALAIADKALDVSRTRFDRVIATIARCQAIIPLRMPGAGDEIAAFLGRCQRSGWMLAYNGPHLMQGLGRVLDGDLAAGIAQIRDRIATNEREHCHASADWGRLYLCEVYLGILTGEGGASLGMILRNAGPIASVYWNGPREIASMIDKVRANPQFDPEGHIIGRAEMVLGLLHRKKGQPAKARAHLSQARRIIGASGASPLLTRIDDALAGLA